MTEDRGTFSPVLRTMQSRRKMVIKLDPNACTAIKETLSEKGLPFCVRIEIQSTGCCDASLGMTPDTAEASDLIKEFEGLTILMRPALYALVGDISISCVDDSRSNEFILVSEKPLNEWAGFGRCVIRI